MKTSQKKTKLKINQTNFKIYTMGLSLSNQYFEVIIKFQKPKIFEMKVELLFGYHRREPQISLLKSKKFLTFITTSNYLCDRAMHKTMLYSQFGYSFKELDNRCFIKFTKYSEAFRAFVWHWIGLTKTRNIVDCGIIPFNILQIIPYLSPFNLEEYSIF